MPTASYSHLTRINSAKNFFLLCFGVSVFDLISVSISNGMRHSREFHKAQSKLRIYTQQKLDSILDSQLVFNVVKVKFREKIYRSARRLAKPKINCYI